MLRLACAALLIAVTAGCSTSRPGAVSASADSPLVVIGAGEVDYGPGEIGARYLIDTRTRQCWFVVSDSLAALDCCALAAVADARPYLTWATPDVCGEAQAPAAPAAAPPAPTAPPAR